HPPPGYGKMCDPSPVPENVPRMPRLAQNSKLEYRNPKQIRNSNPNPISCFLLRASNLFRISLFEFRVYRFPPFPTSDRFRYARMRGRPPLVSITASTRAVMPPGPSSVPTT